MIKYSFGHLDVEAESEPWHVQKTKLADWFFVVRDYMAKAGSCVDPPVIYIGEGAAKILFKEFDELEDPAVVFSHEKYKAYFEDSGDSYADSD